MTVKCALPKNSKCRSVLIREVSLFQGLKSTQTWYILGEEESVLFSEESLFQGCAYRWMPLYTCIHSFTHDTQWNSSNLDTNNNNNNTQKAALAKLPLTTHPHERAEPHTLQTQFTPACTTWPSPLPCETPDLPDLPTLPPTPATGPRSPAED